jgi:hypothetical protein
MQLKTWEDAEVAGTEFAELTSQLEILKEQLREFCERRHDNIGKARLLGPVLMGFRKEAATVVVEDEPMAISALKGVVGTHEFGRLVKQVEELDRPLLKTYFRAASEAVRGELLEIGITLRAATEKFYVKLARQNSDES